LALATEQTAVLADLALLALANNKRRQEETAKKQCRVDAECVMAPVLPPNLVDVAIQCIWAECALFAAPLDANLAKIARNDFTHDV
jgi:hypothetical protein